MFQSKNRIFLIIGIIVLAIVLTWAYIESTKPLPGVEALQDSREHLPQGQAVTYNSNPPTSGAHYADWIRSGVYDVPQPDGNLVHSLEHGYVIMWYRCLDKTGFNLVSQVDAQELQATDSEATDSGQVATDSAKLPPAFETRECKQLVNDLRGIYEKKGKRKLIIVPRINMDTKIALTSWGRIDKMDNFDSVRIENFIDKLRDRGPEQTME